MKLFQGLKRKISSPTPKVKQIAERMKKTDNLDHLAIPDLFAVRVHILRNLKSNS